MKCAAGSPPTSPSPIYVPYTINTSWASFSDSLSMVQTASSDDVHHTTTAPIYPWYRPSDIMPDFTRVQRTLLEWSSKSGNDSMEDYFYRHPKVPRKYPSASVSHPNDKFFFWVRKRIGLRPLWEFLLLRYPLWTCPKSSKLTKNIPTGSNLRAKIAQKLPARFNLRTKKNLPDVYCLTMGSNSLTVLD